MEIFFKMLCLKAKRTLSGFSWNLGSATILASRHVFLSSLQGWSSCKYKRQGNKSAGNCSGAGQIWFVDHLAGWFCWKLINKDEAWIHEDDSRKWRRKAICTRVQEDFGGFVLVRGWRQDYESTTFPLLPRFWKSSCSGLGILLLMTRCWRILISTWSSMLLVEDTQKFFSFSWTMGILWYVQDQHYNGTICLWACIVVIIVMMHVQIGPWGSLGWLSHSSWACCSQWMRQNLCPLDSKASDRFKQWMVSAGTGVYG